MNRVLRRGWIPLITAVVLVGASPLIGASATVVPTPQPAGMTMRPMTPSTGVGTSVGPAVWVLPPASQGMARASGVAVARSLNWSGYVQEGTGFTSAQIDWTVPTVAPSATNKYSSAWVGVDGAQNTSLIQVGTDQNWVNGSAQYDAWWEILPAASVPFASVSPGEHIRAQVVQQTPGTWVISLLNLTRNTGYVGTFSYSGPATSAEFIVERPSSCLAVSCILPLADFGTVNFGALASAGSPSTTFPVDMEDGSGTVIAHTSAPGPGNDFNVTQPVVQPPPPPPKLGPGYWMVGSSGVVYPFGSASSFGDLGGQAAAIVKLEPTPDSRGYWLLDSFGSVFTYGDARYLGGLTTANMGPGETATSLSSTQTGNGYWIFTNRGRVIPFGDAPFYGDLSGIPLNGPVLGSIATTTGRGYYLVASDGGIFTFGDAVFYGSTGNIRLNRPVMSMVPTSDGAGYWLVASDGGIFTFGDALFRGSLGAIRLNKPVVGIVRYGDGYLMVGADGGIFDFSDSPFLGSLGANPPPWPIVSVASVST
jgi:hypothetical protein